jgi:large subunit ribosomal protein L21
VYAVISSGSKQQRVEVGQRVRVELLGQAPGEEVSFRAVLVVDGEQCLARPDELAGARVTGRVIGRVSGPKVRGFTYKPKTNQRRRFGHRQRYDEVEITAIERAG